MGGYTSITIGAESRGLIGSYDGTNVDLKVAHCSNRYRSAATMTPLDTVGTVGASTSITIAADGLGLVSYYDAGNGADGLGLISYYDLTNGDLKVAHCSNVFCAPYFRRR